jgi:hypothetical protein
MNPRLNSPPESKSDLLTPGCAALAALSPLAARTLLRCCAAWDLLDAATQACLLRRVSSGPVHEAAAVRAALATLMVSNEWKGSRAAQRSALEQLAALTSMPSWLGSSGEPTGRH